jgi:hypothetical protein
MGLGRPDLTRQDRPARRGPCIFAARPDQAQTGHPRLDLEWFTQLGGSPAFCRPPDRRPPWAADGPPSRGRGGSSRFHGGSTRLRRQTPWLRSRATSGSNAHSCRSTDRRGQAGIAEGLQVNLGAGAYRAIWGYGVGPPSDTSHSALTLDYATCVSFKRGIAAAHEHGGSTRPPTLTGCLRPHARSHPGLA